MELTKKLCKTGLLIFGFVTLVAYIAWLMGNNFFFLENWNVRFSSSWLGDNFVKIVFFFTNALFYIGFIMKTKIGEAVRLTIFYLILCLAIWFAFGTPDASFFNLLFTGILFLPFCLLIKNDTSAKSKIIRYIVFTLAVIVYQTLICPIKFNLVLLGADASTIYTNILSLVFFQIDFIIYLALLYLIGGDSYGRLSWQHLVHPRKIRNCETSEETDESLKWYDSLTGWTKVKAVMLFFGIQLAQFIVILAAVSLSNRLLEFCLILPSFFLFRRVLVYCWHSSSLIICTALSCIIFYAGCIITLPLNLSMAMPIILGFVIAWGLYQAYYLSGKEVVS